MGKVRLRAKIYNELVLPTYRDAGIRPPDAKTWLKGTINVDHINPEEQFRSKWGDVGIRSGVEALGHATEMELAGAKFTHKMFMSGYTHVFDYYNPSGLDIGSAYDDGFKKFIDKSFNRLETVFDNTLTRDNFWLQTHPAKTKAGSAAGWTAGQIGELPFYIAMDEAVLAGAAATGIGRVSAWGLKLAESPAGKVLARRTLTDVLGETAKGRIVARTLHGAASGFALTYGIQGKSYKEGIESAAGWGLFGLVGGSVLEGGAKIAGSKLASAVKSGVEKTIPAPVLMSAGAIKQWSSDLIRQGGKPLAFSFIESAFADAFKDKHLGISIQPEFKVPKAGAEQAPIWTPLHGDDLAYVTIGHPDAHIIGDISINPDISSPQAGHLVYDGQVYPYSNMNEMQSQMNYLINKGRAADKQPTIISTDVKIGEPASKETMEKSNVEASNPLAQILRDVKLMPHTSVPNSGYLVKDGKYYPYSNHEQAILQYNVLAEVTEAKRAEADPVFHAVNSVEQKVLRDISEQLHGTRAISTLNAQQISEVIARRAEMVHEAADELAARQPEMVKQEVEANVIANREKNPELAKLDEEFEKKFGISVTDSATDEIVKEEKERTGISNKSKKLEQIGKMIDKLEGVTPEQKAVAKKQAAELAQVKSPKKSKAKEEEPKEGASASYNYKEVMGGISKTYTDSKAYFKNRSPRLASDGTLVGKRDKRPWNERVADEHTRYFMETLKMADGDAINFEKDGDRLLFHWGNRKDMDAKLAGKIKYELDKAFNTEGNHFSTADYDQASDNLGKHLIMLAKTGKLTLIGDPSKTGNVFKSSNFFFDPTKHQYDLVVDTQDAELKQLESTLANHPESLEMMSTLLGVLQGNRNKAHYNINDWLEWNRVIDNFSIGIIPRGMEQVKAKGMTYATGRD